MKNVVILGSTGSIGVQTLEVVEKLNDKLMNKMAARCNDDWDAERLAKLCEEDIWLEPEEALAMGLIDEIIKER